jgi:hypothetical protein
MILIAIQKCVKPKLIINKREYVCNSTILLFFIICSGFVVVKTKFIAYKYDFL